MARATGAFVKIASLICLALITVQSAAAANQDLCKTFTATAEPYETSANSQGQQISAGFTCPTNASHYDCLSTDKGNKFFHGCTLKTAGIFSGRGHTNISTDLISESDQAFLYPLASDAVKPARKKFGYGRIYSPVYTPLKQYLQGCVSHSGIFDPFPGCMRQGESGYIEWFPSLICIEGVVGECSATSRLTNGTPIKVCGVVPATGFFPHGDSFPVPVTQYHKVSEAEAKNKSSNPALAHGGRACLRNAASGNHVVGGKSLWALTVAALMAFVFS